MERIKSKKHKFLLIPLFIFLAATVLVYFHDREAFIPMTVVILIIIGRIFYKAYIDKTENSYGYFINQSGIIVNKVNVYEWNAMKITRIKDYWLLGREITIEHETDKKMKTLDIALDFAYKDAFLSQLNHYAPKNHPLVIAVEDYFNQK